jgi:hypothetical protein
MPRIDIVARAAGQQFQFQRHRHIDGYRNPDLDGYDWRDGVQAHTKPTPPPEGATP